MLFTSLSSSAHVYVIMCNKANNIHANKTFAIGLEENSAGPCKHSAQKNFPVWYTMHYQNTDVVYYTVLLLLIAISNSAIITIINEALDQ